MDEMKISHLSAAILEDYKYKDETSWNDVANRIFGGGDLLPGMAERLKAGFMRDNVFATPNLTNLYAITDDKARGLPISCFIYKPGDNMQDIAFKHFEAKTLAYNGGGCSGNYDLIRELGSSITDKGESSGVVPVLVEADKMIACTGQGGTRRGILAAWLKVDNPEILEFIKIKDLHSGKMTRKTPDIFPGVILTKEFLHAKDNLLPYNLYSRHDGSVVATLDAFDVWTQIMDSRHDTGTPFMAFEENMQKNCGAVYEAGIRAKVVRISETNVCTEIFVNVTPTSTGVCNLGSLNLSNWDDMEARIDEIIFDMAYFMDSVNDETLRLISNFESETERMAYKNVVNFIENDGSIAIGVFGFHDYLQSKFIPFDSLAAKYINIKIFKTIRAAADKANVRIAELKGARSLPASLGLNHRFATMLAIAPTGSISKVAKSKIGKQPTSPSIEPKTSNKYTEKRQQGSFPYMNPYLSKWMEEHLDEEEIRYVNDHLNLNDGSVQGIHEDIMSQEVKDVFKCAHEIDQHVLIEHASDRQIHIDQGQSLNLFFHVNAAKHYINSVHTLAHQRDVKSLYYFKPVNGGNISFKIRECANCT